MEPLPLELVQWLVYFLLAAKAAPLPAPRHRCAVFPCALSRSLCPLSFVVFVWRFRVRVHFAQTLPRQRPGHCSPAPIVRSFAVARCPQSLWLLHSSPFLERSSFLTVGSCCSVRLTENRQAVAVQGAWDAPGREHGDLNDGTGGHGHSGILWHVSYVTISTFTSGKGVFGEDCCPTLYFYSSCVQWNIKCNSQPDHLFTVPLPSYKYGDNIYLTWSLRCAWL